MLLEDYPLPMQRAIKTRDAASQPLSAALQTLDVSWSILEGNAVELGKAMALFSNGAAPLTAGALSIWQNHGASHHYHRAIIRLFHNFLSAATAHLAHMGRHAGALKSHISVHIRNSAGGTTRCGGEWTSS
jgi:hypothetical protein